MNLQQTDRLDPSFLYLLCLFSSRTSRDYGPLCKNPGTSRPWQATGVAPISVLNDKVAAAGPLQDLASASAWALFPGPGGFQLSTHSLPRH